MNTVYFVGGTQYKVIKGVFIVVVAMIAVYTDRLFVDIDGDDASCDFVYFFRLGLQSSSCCILSGEIVIASVTAMLESCEPLRYFSLK